MTTNGTNTIEWVLGRDETFRYMLLGRLQMDCGRYLDCTYRNVSKLWAGDEKEHIKYMKAIWRSFPKDKRPKWLKFAQIERYEKAMLARMQSEA